MKEEHFVYAMVGIMAACAMSVAGLLVASIALNGVPLQYFTSPLLLIVGVAIFAMKATESRIDGRSTRQSLWDGAQSAAFALGLGLAALVIALADLHQLSKVWILGVVVFGSLLAIYLSCGVVKVARTVRNFT